MPAATAEERELHRRLIEGDPVAPAELAEQYLEPLLARLRRRLPYADEQLLLDVSVDSVLALPLQPRKYDPERLGLLAYLVMDAGGDARNLLEREQRRGSRLTPIESVEHSAFSRNTDAEGPEAALLRKEGFELPQGLTREDVLMQIEQAFPDERDRRALELMQEGERHTSEFAALYGLTELEPAAQRREVKRIKDRLKKKLERLRERLASRHGLYAVPAGSNLPNRPNQGNCDAAT